MTKKNHLFFVLILTVILLIAGTDRIFIKNSKAATSISDGDLVKSSDSSALYLISSGKKRVFPHSAVYNSWGYPRNFSTVKVVSPSALAAIASSDPIPFRDGAMFRGTSQSLYGKDQTAVFYVSETKLRAIKSAEVYWKLFEPEKTSIDKLAWKYITWVPDDLLSKFAYPQGADLEDFAKHPNGGLIKYSSGGTVYLIQSGKKRGFASSAAFNANRYNISQDIVPVFTVSSAETYSSGANIAGLEQSLVTPAYLSSPTCSPCTLGSGNYNYTLSHNGLTRKFNVYVPASYNKTQAAPLIISLHGDCANASQQATMSEQKQKADSAGFIAVFPEGVSSGKSCDQSWNAGSCCVQAINMNPRPDDVGFVNALINNVKSKFYINEKRVYATGISNGAFLAQRLACELSDKIAAIAPVAGVLGTSNILGDFKTCAPKRPVPIMEFHGTSDPVIKYSGNILWPSVDSTIAGWVSRNKCSIQPVTTYQKADVTCQTYNNCQDNAEVTLCKIQNGGHTWPGGDGCPKDTSLGQCTGDISATDHMWDFFQKYSLP